MDKYKPNRNVRRSFEEIRIDVENEKKAHVATIEASEVVKRINVELKSLGSYLDDEREERMVEDKKVKRSTITWNVISLLVALSALALEVLQNWDDIARFLKSLLK